MNGNDEKNGKNPGYIPKDGFLTAEEIAYRLRLASVDNLKKSLDKHSIKFVDIAGKRIYDCSQFERLFFD